ncbi:MAG: hypothetical protein EXS17_03980 [Phycisphaerales bacterium]|nr:hypothetical protein [Phycisphaerales bacterium]
MMTPKLLLAISCALALSCVARGDALDDVLALIPAEAASAVVVPSLQKLSGDLDECIARMDRKETLVSGRSIDHLKRALQLREGFDERGSLAAWTIAEAVVLLVPCDDPATFAAKNLAPGSDGVTLFRGEAVHTKALAKHLLISTSKAAVDGYDAKGGTVASLTTRLGQQGIALARGGDLIAWSGATALSAMTAVNERATTRARELLAGIADALLVVDADALGLSLRAYIVYAAESELAQLAADTKPLLGSCGSTLAGLPKAPFYLAAAIDAQALGGTSKIDALAAALGATAVIPAWFAQVKDGVRSVQIAAYPSKLGLLAGGLLNDSSFVIESAHPEKIRDLFKSSLLAQAGASGGVRREPAWEDARALKDGVVVEAFELKETPLGASEALGEDLSGVAMQQLMRQAFFGGRGMHGFVKVLPSAVVVTFSQRPDVLARALAAANGGESLKDESVLVSMRPWLVPGAQCELFISAGQILKVVRQLAATFGGAGMPLPTIAAKSAPVAIALRIDPRAAEFGVMIPTATLAAVYEQMMNSFIGGSPGAPPTRADDAAPTPEAVEPAKE